MTRRRVYGIHEREATRGTIPLESRNGLKNDAAFGTGAARCSRFGDAQYFSMFRQRESRLPQPDVTATRFRQVVEFWTWSPRSAPRPPIPVGRIKTFRGADHDQSARIVK